MSNEPATAEAPATVKKAAIIREAIEKQPGCTTEQIQQYTQTHYGTEVLPRDVASVRSKLRAKDKPATAPGRTDDSFTGEEILMATTAANHVGGFGRLQQICTLMAKINQQG